MDRRYFWQLVNKYRRKTAKSMKAVKDEQGQMLTDPKALCDTWGEYFKDLYTPQDQPGKFDDDFKEHVTHRLQQMETESHGCDSGTVLKEVFSVHEIARICDKLKKGKAAGWDGVYPEHIIFGGPTLRRALTAIFNNIVAGEYVPKAFRKGIVIPIPKGDKDTSNKDNYRGITLLPTISKIFEKALLLRAEPWLQSGVIDQRQGANIQKCSSIHTSLLLQETIAHNAERGATVYTAFLDTKRPLTLFGSRGSSTSYSMQEWTGNYGAYSGTTTWTSNAE